VVVDITVVADITDTAGTWRLVYTEQFETRVEALRREKQLKSYRGRVFLKEKLSLDG
jgi:predicted GIY-YIG superfamily endonuclease